MVRDHGPSATVADRQEIAVAACALAHETQLIASQVEKIAQEREAPGAGRDKGSDRATGTIERC